MSDFTGRFTGKLDSHYDYHCWSKVDVDCVDYQTFREIIDAVAPILDKESERIKEYVRNKG